MGSVRPFFFGEHEVRAYLDEQDNPWFVAKDVCAVLDISWKGSDTTGPLDEDERGTHNVGTPGGPQEMVTVSESGLYTLIFTSRKAAAKAFRKWVTAEVLPALRRTGRYDMRRRALDRETEVDPIIAAAQRGLKEVSRVRLMEIALQLAKLDDEGKARMLDSYASLCGIVREKSVPTQFALNSAEAEVHEDMLMAWAEARLESSHKLTQAKYIQADFEAWCDEQGILPENRPSHIRLGKFMGRHYERVRSNVNYYRGVQIRSQGGEGNA
jgi:prophage antirepressor-like protein